MRNQRGLITVDFLFAITLIFGMTVLMFLLSMTLSVASITQYITYAAARNYGVGHIDEATQKQRAVAKYKELINLKVFKPLFNGGWFAIDAEPALGDHTKIIPDYGSAAEDQNKFWGAGANFTAKVLEYNIPFFGSTVPEGNGSGEGFKIYMASYLGREPTEKECIEFMAARWAKIRTLDSRYNGVPGGTYYPMTDDGC